jgi:glycosyltransferase involved in cell wall biosynthesis
LFLLRKVFHFKLIVWTHGVKSKEMLQPFSSRQSKMQLRVYNKADAVILYSQKRKELLAQRINNPEKLFVAQNTLDTETLNKIYSQLEAKGEVAVKEELGFRHQFNLIFIGRLVPAKRLDLLLEAFKGISGKYDVALHIIGNGPEEEKIEAEAAAHDNILYHGPIHDLELSSKYLFASDLMVMPGYVGLSVVHAMAMGCPILTCKQSPEGPYHSPEVEYIHDGENGLFCNYSADGLKEAMTDLLRQPEKLTTMSGNARKTIREEAGIDRFVAGFEEAVGYVGGLPSRPQPPEGAGWHTNNLGSKAQAPL